MTKLSTTVAVALTAVWLFVSSVHGRSSGAPTAACRTMMPQHGTNSAQVGHGGFQVTTNVPATYALSTRYLVTVNSTSTARIQGLFCQARNSRAGTVSPGVGMFELPSSGLLKSVNCEGQTGLGGTNSLAAITHSAKLDTLSSSFIWISPPAPAGNLSMRCSIVEAYNMFYVQIPSAEFLAPDAVPTTSAPASTPPAGLLPAGLLNDCKSTTETAFCFGHPFGCQGTSDCSYIYTHRANVSHITVELFAKLGSGTGWAAVAYSNDSKMGNDDVLACDISSAGIVTAKNLWNAGRTNRADAGGSTSFLTLLETARDGNSIYCRFSRLLATGAADDFNLSRGHLYFYGTRTSGNAAPSAALSGQHNRNPLVSRIAHSASSIGVGQASAQNRVAVTWGILILMMAVSVFVV